MFKWHFLFLRCHFHGWNINFFSNTLTKNCRFAWTPIYLAVLKVTFITNTKLHFNRLRLLWLLYQFIMFSTYTFADYLSIYKIQSKFIFSYFYSLDVRGKPLGQAQHWSESTSLGKRTSFRTTTPNGLLVEGLKLKVRIIYIMLLRNIISLLNVIWCQCKW